MRLQNCPFCGESEHKSVVGLVTDCAIEGRTTGDSEYFAVVCDYRAGGCGASGGYNVDPDKAVAKWNKRVGGGQ